MPRLSDIRPAFYAALRIGPKGKRTVATVDSVRYMALVKVIKEKKARTGAGINPFWLLIIHPAFIWRR